MARTAAIKMSVRCTRARGYLARCARPRSGAWSLPRAPRTFAPSARCSNREAMVRCSRSEQTRMSDDEAKQRAARAALELLPESGVIGLGTGSTTRFFIEGVAELVRAGRKFIGVPTSQQSRALATQLGIPLLDDAGPWHIDLCVDGADEVSESRDLIKGGGAAHTREKIVNFAANKNAIIVDESKLSQRLGEKWAIPVKMLVFGHLTTKRALERFGR